VQVAATFDVDRLNSILFYTRTTHNHLLPHREAILFGTVDGANSAGVRDAGGIFLVQRVAADVALESCKSRKIHKSVERQKTICE